MKIKLAKDSKLKNRKTIKAGEYEIAQVLKNTVLFVTPRGKSFCILIKDWMKMVETGQIDLV